MKVYSLHYKQIVNRSLGDVFDFFSNPENLSKITPKKLDFKIMTPGPIKMMNGQLIDYTIRLFRIRVHWRTLITDYDPPNSFIDQQIKGPYLLWHHEHLFREVEGGVEIVDTVHYTIPFGIIGRLLHWAWIKRDLDNIFSYRKNIINKFFQNDEKENR